MCLVLDKIWNEDTQDNILCTVINNLYKIFSAHIKDLQCGEITDDVIDGYLDVISKEINV